MVTSGGAEATLLLDTVDGAVDFRGRSVLRSRSGGWRAAAFIIGVEVGERFAYFGIGTNLINYLTGPLGESTIMAAQNVNLYVGVSSLLPLLGAFLADSFLGRYRTILYASLLYILGLGLMTLSATPIVSNLKWKEILFFLSLYIAALAQGGHKPCIEAFGADQFERENPEENKARSSFFNWWYFSFNAGLLVTVSILNYIQDNRGWVLGYGIPCIAMLFALLIFLFGTWNYRFNIIRRDRENSPFWRISKVFMAALSNNSTSPLASEEEAPDGALPHNGSEQFRFLNKALISSNNGSKEDEKKVCSVNEVEEAKAVLRLIPIWATNLIYAIIIAQVATFFTKQGVTLDRKILLGFTIPSASLQTFIILTIVLLIPIYDRIIVPISRSLTTNPSGITMLQRIGTGIFLSAIAMVIAVFVEMKRLKTARDYGLIDMPNVTIPMSIWWLIPQYVLLGVSDVFTIVGLQEFFYDQVPDEIRSVGIAFYISIFGVGSFLSSFLISVIQNVTGGGDDGDGWFNTNLNRARLDCFYAVLAALDVLGWFAFLYFSKSYVYKRVRT